MYHYNIDFEQLKELAPPEYSFIVTDENLEMLYHDEMKPWKSIVIAPGEASKDWSVIDNIIVELLSLNAGRDAIIIGIGGGVVTDIAGFIAAIYKRGVDCILMPTSLLAMVDAAIGGKNGINVRAYKNMIGTIRMPKAVAYNFNVLNTLPQEEWINGFAEIIKHAAINDAELFSALENNNIDSYRNNSELLIELIKRNVAIKHDIISNDLQDQGLRKILNFGHTLGHAIEKFSNLPHGYAIAIGMTFAARLSEEHFGKNNIVKRITALLEQYKLPTDIEWNKEVVITNIIKDKKRFAQSIDYILLEEIGKAVITPIPIEELKEIIHSY